MKKLPIIIFYEARQFSFIYQAYDERNEIPTWNVEFVIQELFGFKKKTV